MRVDVVTVFPEYLAPARLSLLGKAIGAGTLQLHIHDLRKWTTDRHRTVDDTPYGGGPGMVMRPDVWGDALDDVLESLSPETRIVVPTPSGIPLTQRRVEDYAQVPGLVIACGRYEGIDARVWQHFSKRFAVDELSIGDYVLAGGEVVSLVILEAVARLLPGVLGNEASAADDSFAQERPGGALEGPVYTKPRSWRGLDVPTVLTSGDHAKVAEWRLQQSLRRTASNRPDLGLGTEEITGQ